MQWQDRHNSQLRSQNTENPFDAIKEALCESKMSLSCRKCKIARVASQTEVSFLTHNMGANWPRRRETIEASPYCINYFKLENALQVNWPIKKSIGWETKGGEIMEIIITANTAWGAKINRQGLNGGRAGGKICLEADERWIMPVLCMVKSGVGYSMAW